MRAAILAGGEGTRLRPLTDKKPKPLIPVYNTPMIERVVRVLEQAGIEEVVIVIRHHTEIKNYLEEKGMKIKTKYIEKDTKNIFDAFSVLKDEFKENFFFFNSDLIFNPKAFCKFIDDVKDSKNDLVMCVSKKVSDPHHPRVVMDENLKIINADYDVKSDYFVAGLYLCSPKIFREVEAAKRMGIPHFLEFIVKLIIKKGYDVKGYIFPKVIDINTFEDLKKAEEFLQNLESSKVIK